MFGVVLDLRDKDNESQFKIVCKVAAEETVDDLQKKIQSIFGISPLEQDISFSNEPLFWGNLTENGVKHRDTIIVKHTWLRQWTVFLLASDIPPNTPHAARKKQVLEASHILENLYARGFFTVYAEYALRRIKFNREFSEFIDDHDEYTRKAVELYFTALMEKKPENPTLSFNYFEKSVMGIQAGFICSVNCGETIQRFYVKEASAMSSRQNVDLREIFMYKLLYQIGVGPSVHIIPKTHESVIGVYIATSEVVDFKPSHKTELSVKAELMLDLIRRLFNVTDLHEDNYGLDSDGNLSIIDFRISGNSFDSRNRNVWRSDKQQPENLKIVGEILNHWSLPKALHDANESFNDTKELLKKRNPSCMASQRYARYFDSICQNVDDCIHD